MILFKLGLRANCIWIFYKCYSKANNFELKKLFAGWRHERLSQAPEEPYFSIAPDWICEVLSPSTTALDRVKKMPLYAEIGVSHFWLVDPIHKTLEVYMNDHMSWKLLKTYANDDKVRAAPFVMPLNLIFQHCGSRGLQVDNKKESNSVLIGIVMILVTVAYFGISAILQ
jgi:hypothetical protein